MWYCEKMNLDYSSCIPDHKIKQVPFGLEGKWQKVNQGGISHYLQIRDLSITGAIKSDKDEADHQIPSFIWRWRIGHTLRQYTYQKRFRVQPFEG